MSLPRITFRNIMIGLSCFNSAVAGLSLIYVGGRTLYHLLQRRNNPDQIVKLDRRLINDLTSLKTAALGLPPIVGIFLAAKYGNLGLSSATSIDDSTSISLVRKAVETAVNQAFFPLQTDPPPGPEAATARQYFIDQVNGEEVVLDKGNEQTLPAVFVSKSNNRGSVQPDDLCVIMSHGNGMQLEGMMNFVTDVRHMDRGRNSVLVYTLDGYGPNRKNNVETCEESAKFDALAAVDFALKRGYKPEQIVFFGYSIGTVGAAAAAHLAKTHCILYKGFTTGADVAGNACKNAHRMLPLGFEQKWYGNLISWAQDQSSDFAKTLLHPESGKVASRKFTTQHLDVEVPINGMNNRWHIENMNPARFLHCIGGSQDHLMAHGWNEQENRYDNNFAQTLCRSGRSKYSSYVILSGQGHIGDEIGANTGCRVSRMLEQIRETNCPTSRL